MGFFFKSNILVSSQQQVRLLATLSICMFCSTYKDEFVKVLVIFKPYQLHCKG